MLERRFAVIDADSAAATIICEPRANVSRGRLAWIPPDPTKPLGMWASEHHAGAEGAGEASGTVLEQTRADERWRAK